MAKGAKGLYLEGWKFSVYLALPLLASWYYNDPLRQQASVEYWKYVQYPPNPNTDLRKRVLEDQAKQKEQREQREAYRQQMQALQEQAQRSRAAAALEEEEAARKRSWTSLLGWSRKEA
jgi:hypothetical protein